MATTLQPGAFLTVDESMAQWKGKGMPGLMTVPRKPTPVGREAHTTADVETGAIIFSEFYEGKALMASKEFVRPYGKNPAKALRCSKPWHGTGRTLILDSGFASKACAVGCADCGLFMIGNVKGGHRDFPKKWLLDNVKERGDRAVATASFRSASGETWTMLAAADRDKQPMTLLGTAGTSMEAPPLVRKFKVIRSDGTFAIRTATLEQMDIHAKYRSKFNVVDMNNAKRQGGDSFEDSWKTHTWWVRDFQMLLGMSEVNAYLLMRYFGEDPSMRMADFRSRLTFQLLHHPVLMLERGVGIGTRGMFAKSPHVPKLNLAPSGKCGKPAKGRCRHCGKQTCWHCTCAPHGGTSKPMYICPPNKRPECFVRHKDGEAPPKRKSEAMVRVWATAKAGIGPDRNVRRRNI